MTLQELLGEKYKDGMSVEEINAVLQELNVQVGDDDNSNNELSELQGKLEKLKSAISKANSEAATYKRALRDKQTEEEKRADELSETLEALKMQNAELMKEKTIAEHKSSYLKMGYSEDIAGGIANALVDNNIDDLIRLNSEHLNSLESTIKSKMTKNVPTPNKDIVSNDITQEKFNEMNYTQRAELFNNNRELYDKYSGV